jgi:hypothetical protein
MQSGVFLLEADALVTMQDRGAAPRKAVSLADGLWDVGDLVPTRFAGVDYAAEPAERLQEEALDVVRLEAPRMRPFHLLLDRLHLRGVHAVVDEGPGCEQLLELLARDAAFYLLVDLLGSRKA